MGGGGGGGEPIKKNQGCHGGSPNLKWNPINFGEAPPKTEE